MKTLNVSYSVWKQVVDNNSFTPYFYEDGIEMGKVWAGTDETVFHAEIDADTYPDFDTDFPSGVRVDVEEHDDALAMIIGLEEVPSAPAFDTTANGIVVSPSYGHYPNESGRYKNVALKAVADATTIEDFRITQEIYLQGADFWVASGHWEDIVDFSVVDKDDVLGLFGYLGLTVGQDILELVRHVDHYPVKPGDSQGSFYPPSHAEVASGLYLRVKYENNNPDEDAYLGVTFMCFER